MGGVRISHLGAAVALIGALWFRKNVSHKKASRNGQQDVATSGVNAQQQHRLTPLHLASREGHVEVVRHLIESGEDVNAKDKDGRTPLHLASQHDSVETVHLLLEAGADVNAFDNAGYTSLGLAAERGFLDVIKLLTGRNADVNIRDETRNEALASQEVVPRQNSTAYDLFLAHSWGDSPAHDNHQRVKKINELLQSVGFVTWLDEEQMVGWVAQQICDGIDNSKVILVFLTTHYMERVRVTDNYCSREFAYAVHTKALDDLVPVVMENALKTPRDWPGGVAKMYLVDRLYVPMTNDGEVDKAFASTSQLLKILKELGVNPRENGRRGNSGT